MVTVETSEEHVDILIERNNAVEQVADEMTNEIVENVTNAEGKKTKIRRGKGKKLIKMTLNDVLEVSCWDPDDLEQWRQWSSDETRDLDAVYPGIRVYNIHTHCRQVIIKAKKHSNGGYQIIETLVKDHR